MLTDQLALMNIIFMVLFVCLFVCCLGFFFLETPLHAVSDKTYFTEVGTETKKAEQWIEDDNLG